MSFGAPPPAPSSVGKRSSRVSHRRSTSLIQAPASRPSRPSVYRPPTSNGFVVQPRRASPRAEAHVGPRPLPGDSPGGPDISNGTVSGAASAREAIPRIQRAFGTPRTSREPPPEETSQARSLSPDARLEVGQRLYAEHLKKEARMAQRRIEAEEEEMRQIKESEVGSSRMFRPLSKAWSSPEFDGASAAERLFQDAENRRRLQMQKLREHEKRQRAASSGGVLSASTIAASAERLHGEHKNRQQRLECKRKETEEAERLKLEREDVSAAAASQSASSVEQGSRYSKLYDDARHKRQRFEISRQKTLESEAEKLGGHRRPGAMPLSEERIEQLYSVHRHKLMRHRQMRVEKAEKEAKEIEDAKLAVAKLTSSSKLLYRSKEPVWMVMSKSWQSEPQEEPQPPTPRSPPEPTAVAAGLLVGALVAAASLHRAGRSYGASWSR